MKRSLLFPSLSAMAAVLGLGQMIGCESQPAEDGASQQAAALAACHLDDGTVDLNADLHACDPQSTKKTTICHIPPGNPANAHTICVGNPAVPAHLRNHGDYLGACQSETPCPPPPESGVGGAPGVGGASGGGQPAGTGGASAPPIIP
jgi:hypothetical protein